MATADDAARAESRDRCSLFIEQDSGIKLGEDGHYTNSPSGFTCLPAPGAFESVELAVEFAAQLLDDGIRTRGMAINVAGGSDLVTYDPANGFKSVNAVISPQLADSLDYANNVWKATVPVFTAWDAEQSTRIIDSLEAERDQLQEEIASLAEEVAKLRAESMAAEKALDAANREAESLAETQSWRSPDETVEKTPFPRLDEFEVTKDEDDPGVTYYRKEFADGSYLSITSEDGKAPTHWAIHEETVSGYREVSGIGWLGVDSAWKNMLAEAGDSFAPPVNKDAGRLSSNKSRSVSVPDKGPRNAGGNFAFDTAKARNSAMAQSTSQRIRNAQSLNNPNR